MKKNNLLMAATLGITLVLAGCNSQNLGTKSGDQLAQTQFENSDNVASSTIDDGIITNDKPIKLPPKTDFGNNAGVPPVTTIVPPPPAAKDLKEVGIAITATGFKPALINIKPGTKVVFINVDSAPHWPASDPHPTHGLCKGFDAKKALTKGQSYSFTFTETKTCTYHDHLNPATKGTVIVK